MKRFCDFCGEVIQVERSHRIASKYGVFYIVRQEGIGKKIEDADACVECSCKISKFLKEIMRLK